MSNDPSLSGPSVPEGNGPTIETTPAPQPVIETAPAPQSSLSPLPANTGNSAEMMRGSNKPINTGEDIVPSELTPARSYPGERVESLYPSKNEAFDAAVRMRKGDLAYPLTAIMGVDPDTAANVNRIANQSNLPFDIANANKDDLEKYYKAREVYSTLFQKDEGGNFKYPGTVQWMKNPDRARVSHDDLKALQEIEDVMRSRKQAKEGWLSQAVRAQQSGAIDLVKSVAMIPALLNNMVAATLTPEQQKENLITPIDMATYGPAQFFDAAKGYYKPASMTGNPVEKFAKQGAGSGSAELSYQLLNMSSSLLAYIAAPERAAVALGGAQGANIAYENDKFSGKTADQQAANAAINGVINAVFTKFSTRGVIDKWTNAYRLGLNKPMTYGALAKALGITAFAETASAAAAQGATDYANYVTGDPKGLDNIGPDMANAGLINLVMSAGFAGFPIAHAQRQMVEQRANKQFLDKTLKIVTESKLAKRDPQLAGDFVDGVARQNDVPTEAYISLNQLREVLNQSQVPDANTPVTPDIQAKTEKMIDDMGQQLGITQDVIDAKKSGDGDLALPLGKVVTMYGGTPIGEAITPHLRTEQDGPALGAGPEWMQEKLTNLQTEMAKVQADNVVPDSVLQNVFEPLKKSGKSGEEAMAHTMLFNEMAKMQAAREGKALDAYYKELDLKGEVDSKGNFKLSIGKPSLIESLLGQRNRGSMESFPDKSVINIFKTSDASTLPHEMFHFFDAQIRALVDSGKADARTLEDHAAMQDFVKEFQNEETVRENYKAIKDNPVFDGKSYSSLSPEQRATAASILAREKLARGFEAYLREGKAPSTRLVNAFRTFKKWFLQVYRNITQLDVEINPDIRRVYDRMLASEQDVKNAAEYYDSYGDVSKLLAEKVPAFKESPDTQKSLEELRNAREQSQEAAYEEQAKLYMRAYMDSVGGRQTFRDKATADIDNLPVYKAIAEGIKLNADESAIVHGDDAIKKLQEKYPKMFTAKGEMTLDELAARVGYADPSVMVDELLAAQPRMTAINARTEMLIGAAEDRIRADLIQTSVTPADEAVHNPKSAEYMAAEISLLEDAIAKANNATMVKMNKQAVKDAARDAVANTPVGKARSYASWARQEQNKVKDALKAAKAGDWAKVLEIRKEQYALHLKVNEAIAAGKKITAIENRYSERKISSLLNGVENDYLAPIQSILYNAGLTNHEPPARLIDPEAVKALDDGLLWSYLPDWASSETAVNKIERNYSKNLTYAQFAAMDEWVQMAAHFGRDSLASIKEANLATLGQFKADSIQRMSTIPQWVAPEKGSRVGRVTESLRAGMNWLLVQMPFVADKLDGFSFIGSGETGPMRKLTYKVTAGDALKMEMKRAALEEINPAFLKLYDAKNRIEKQYGANSGGFFLLPDVPVPDKMQAIGHNRWSYQNMVSLLLSYGDPYHRQGLNDTLGITDGHIQAIAAHFTPQELKQLQPVWTAVNKFFDPLDKTFFSLYNRHLVRAEAEPFTLTANDGSQVTLDGGYYPYMHDPSLDGTAAARAEEQDMRINSQSRYTQTAIRRNMTFERTGKYLPPRLDLNVLADHLESVSHYIAFAEVTRDLDRITLDPAWREAAVRALGPDKYQVIRDWASDLKSMDRVESIPWVTNPANWLRARGSDFALTWKFITGLSQRTAIVNGASEIGMSWVAKGFQAVGSDRGGVGTLVLGTTGGKAWDFMMEHSRFVPTREDTINTELRSTMDALMVSNQASLTIAGRRFTLRDVREFGYEWIKANDRAVIAPLWMGAYLKMLDGNKHLGEEVAHAKAVEYADQIIQSTQPSALFTDMTKFQRTQNPILKMFTMFMSWQAKLGNRLTHQYDAWQAGQISNQQYFRHFAYEVMAEPILNMAAKNVMRGMAIPWWMFITAPIMSYLGWIPALDTLTRDAAQLLFPEKRKSAKDVLGNLTETPANTFINLGADLFEDTRKAATGRGEWTRAIWDLQRMAAFGFGVNPGNLVQEVLATYDRYTGEHATKAVTGKEVYKPGK